jgi:hypothetical protein
VPAYAGMTPSDIVRLDVIGDDADWSLPGE